LVDICEDKPHVKGEELAGASVEGEEEGNDDEEKGEWDC
jgi:hypothetical protein